MRRALVSAAVVAALAGSLVAAAPAGAVQPRSHDVVVNADPVNWTPHVLDGKVRAIAEVGDRVVVGGAFTRVRTATSTAEISRTNLFAFDAPSGAIVSTFAPSVPAEVYEILDAGDGRSVYVAGQFANVNGAAGTARIARIDVTTGQTLSTFRSPGFNGIIKDIALRGNRLYVAGSFTTAGGLARTSLAALNKDTGALDAAVNVTFSEPRNGGALQVLKFDVTPDGSRAVVIGNFTKINGLGRYQIGMLDLTTSPTSVVDWSTQGYTSACSSSFDSYMRDVDISPDGSYFVVVTTGAFSGGFAAGTLCDTAARWEVARTGAGQTPTWIDYTGGDTLYSVAITGEAVYIGGHNRWTNNPFASDSAGPGAVSRPGLGALDPVNGLPLSWNPGRTLGVGVFGFLATDRGLWVGSDTDRLGNGEFHGRLALLPLAGGAALPANQTGTLPGNVYSLAPTAGPAGATVVRRAFTGTSVTGSAAVPGGGVAWGSARGAFMVDGTLYTGWSDGTLIARSFDGTTFGAATTVGLNGLTAFSNDLKNVTGMFFSAPTGRLYYTVAGQSRLFYRYFTPESRVVGAVRFDGPANLADLNWTTVSSMFQAGGHLYVASSVDGALRRYTWDGTSPVAGSGTVVSSPAVGGHDWRARGAFVHGANRPPVAALAVDCTLLACSFTGAGSSDPDGTVARYAWAFGDGATATGATASHTYAAAGTYEATLTVTDDQGATATARRTVTVSAQQAQIAFRAGAGTDTNATTATVTVPAGVVAGDALLLFATVNDTVPSVGAPSGVTGWQQVAAKPGSTMQSVLWRKAAAAGDAGKAVTVSLSSIAKVSLQLVAYSGTAAAPVAAHAVATETQSTASHTTPTASVTQAGSWVVSYWADKSSATTSWTVPAGTSSRSTTVGTGSGRITSVVADSGAGVQPGTAGGLTAVANSASAKAVAWTVVLAPGA